MKNNYVNKKAVALSIVAVFITAAFVPAVGSRDYFNSDIVLGEEQLIYDVEQVVPIGNEESICTK